MNFIFFNPDEMRAESLSVYGHPLVRTPNFDRLAAEGTTFDQCHVQHTVCSPSRCSLMTGWYPHTAGHRTLWHLLRPHEPSLFQYMREAGYHVEWYGKNDLYAEASFPACVDHYESKPGGHHGGNPFRPDDPEYYTFLFNPHPGPAEDTGDMRNVQAGIDFLKARKPGDKPFMLYLPLSAPHPGYGAPQPFHDMYEIADLPSLRSAECAGKPDFHALIRRYRRLDRVPEGTLEEIQAIYLGMCSYMDMVLGRLLDALDETGLAEDTAVFVFSDHGDWAGDYGLVEKWPSGLDDCLTRVPLLVRAPGGRTGRKVGEPVELFDVMATTMELAGLKTDHIHYARSFVPQLKGKAGDPGRAVFAEGGYDPHERHCFEGKKSADDIPPDPTNIYYPKGLQQQEYPQSVCRSTMIRTLTHKLIRRPAGISELYDLQQDPQELRNVYQDPAYADIRGILTNRLLDWYIRTADAVPTDADKRGLPA